MLDNIRAHAWGVLRGSLGFALCAALAATFSAPAAKADGLGLKTTVTFSAPIEAGDHALPAGTYVFRQLTPTNPDWIQIMNENQSKTLAVLRTVRAYQLFPKEHVVMQLEERPANLPMAVKKWFDPDLNYGHEFIKPASPRKTGRPAGNVAGE